MSIQKVVFERGEVQIEDENIKVVKKSKTTTKIKEVESFLRFANFH